MPVSCKWSAFSVYVCPYKQGLKAVWPRENHSTSLAPSLFICKSKGGLTKIGGLFHPNILQFLDKVFWGDLIQRALCFMTSLFNERLKCWSNLGSDPQLWTKSRLLNLFHIQQYIDLGNTVVILYHMDPYLPSEKTGYPRGIATARKKKKKNQPKVICQKSRH